MRFLPRSRMPVRTAALLLALFVSFPTMQASAFSRKAVASRVAVLGLELTEAESDSPTDAVALSLAELEAAEAESEAYLPHAWPVRFSEDGRISSLFGDRLDPFTGTTVEFHGGIDLADRLNSKIYASDSGTVIAAERAGGYGLSVKIDHGNGYITRYSHCSSLLVEEGDEVKQGQIIATMGQTGRATGVHLDFRVYLDGELIDPMLVLDEVAD